MLGDGLKEAVRDLAPVEFLLPETGARVSLWITDASVSRPSVVPGAVGCTNKQVLQCSVWDTLYWTLLHQVYPSESRQRGGTYKGKLSARAGYSINGVLPVTQTSQCTVLPPLR